MGLRTKTPSIGKEELEELYLNQKLSCLTIAKMKNISLKQVSRYLKYHDIQARSFSTKGLQTRAGAVLSEETKNKIAEAHVGKTLSEEHKLKIRENAPRGKDNKSWKGGITPINKAIRGSVEYRLWRLDVFERDNHTCVLCEQRGGTLNADHIKPFAYYPELRFDRNNGRTLCIECHRKTETYGRQKQKLLTN